MDDIITAPEGVILDPRRSEVPAGPVVPRSLESFVATVRDAAAGRDPAALHRAVASASPLWTSVAAWVRTHPARVTRALVYRDESVEILVLAWVEGARTPIHDHGGGASWVRVVEGELEVRDYRYILSRDPARYGWLESAGEARRLEAGELEVNGQGADFHSVGAAPGCRLAVTVHVLAPPVDEHLVFEPSRGGFVRRQSHYDFIGPRTRREPLPAGLPLPAPEPEGLRGALVRLFRRARELGQDFLFPSNVGPAGAQVRVERVQHSFGGIEVLRNLSFNVARGEFVCLLGPSGCGKSTLLHALAGHVRPQGGTLTIAGKEVTRPGPDRLLMFQDPALFPWLTVEQNLTFVLGGKGIRRRERRRRARELIRWVHLDGFEDALPHQLSGGMKMRASLARALALDPDVLLMDEPFGALDARTRQRMHRLVQRLWRERHKTIVFVTHDVHEALMLGTRVVVLAPRPGRVILDVDVRLPARRDPDDPIVAHLSRRIRSVMLQEEKRRRAGGSDATVAHVDRGDARPRGPAGPVGAGGGDGPLAETALPEPDGGR